MVGIRLPGHLTIGQISCITRSEKFQPRILTSKSDRTKSICLGLDTALIDLFSTPEIGQCSGFGRIAGNFVLEGVFVILYDERDAQQTNDLLHACIACHIGLDTVQLDGLPHLLLARL